MTISLIHPSRKRPEQALTTFIHWINNMHSVLNLADYIVSVDLDDPTIDDYKNTFVTTLEGIVLVGSNNTCVVEATNVGAKQAKGDILIYVSDDFKCPKNWDLALLELFKGTEDKPMLLKVDDCLQPFDVAILTIPIMNRALYEKLGYFWHPEYKSMFVDEDLYWTCKNNNWLVLAEDLKFPHEHPATGNFPTDETYQRSALNWDQGKAVFAKRKTENFHL